MHTIENILNEYSKRNINLFAYLKIAQKWNIIIGETLYKICYPSFYKNGVLTLTVADSVWANEISMNRLNIFKNIKKETDILCALAARDAMTHAPNIYLILIALIN